MIKDYNKDVNSPAYIHPYLQSIYGKLQLVKDVWEGKSAWFDLESIASFSKVTTRKNSYSSFYKSINWQKAFCYLPQEPEEPDAAYLMRLTRSLFDRKFREFISGDLAGLLSHYSLLDEGASLTKYKKDVDAQGTSLDLFLTNLDILAARDGMVAVLTEMPKDISARSAAEAIATGVRPYWIAIERCNVTFVKSTVVGSLKQITAVGIRSYVEVEDGFFGVKEQERYTIYELVDGIVNFYIFAMEEDASGHTVIRDNKQKSAIPRNGVNRSDAIANLTSDINVDGMVYIDSGIIDLPFIPITFYSLNSSDAFRADISLYDYAELNIEHYQLYSEIREALHASNNPIPVINDRATDYTGTNIRGNSDELFVFGPNTVLRNYDVDKLEFEGKGIEQTLNLLDRVEQTMNAKGLSFITGQHIAKTATEVELNAGQTESRLSVLANNKESAFEKMASHWAAFMGENAIAQIIVDRDLIANISKLSPESMLDAMATGGLSKAFTLDVLNKNKAFGEVLPEEEIERELERSGLGIEGLVEDEVIG